MYDDLTQYGNAIASVESGGSKNPYSLLGPTTRNGDKAYGRYQIMGNNIGPWSQAALGYSMTPQDFLGNQEAQDAVFKHRFGSYVDKYGNPQDAASAWLTGRPIAQAGNAADLYGTTASKYVSKFNAALNGGAPMASAFADNRTAQMNPMEAAMQPPQAGSDANQYAYAPNYDQNAGLFDRLRQGGPGALFGAPGGVFPGKDGRPGYDLGNKLQRAGMFAMAASNPSVLGALGQTAPDRKFVQIGTDDLGNPRYGWVDPKSGSVVPTSGTGGGAASGGAGGGGMGDSVTAALKSGTTGEELLNQPGISPVIASLVRSISGGAEPYSPSQLMRTPRGTAAMALLKQYEPNATEADFMGRQAGMKDWATKSGDIVRRANQAALHSGELVDSFKAVNNTDYPAVNAVKNFVTEQTGGGAPGAARTNVTALANELGAMVRGNGGSDASFNEWRDAFPVNGSPEQQRAAMAKVTSLFEDSMTALEEKRRQAVGPAQAAKLGPLMPKNVRAALDKAKAYSSGGQLPAGVTSIKQISP